jgi:hypothetical protein
MSWLRLMEETLKKEEALPEEGQTEAGQTQLVGRKHRLVSLVKEMWPAYLIEIIVIILGISITLALEEWRDNSKENDLENVYHRNLQADIEVDVQSLGFVKESSIQIISHGNELMAFTRNPQAKEITPERVEADVRSILGRPKFLSSDATFSDLKSSGNLHLLKDIQLKNMLFDYYSHTQTIRDIQDAEQQATINLAGNYFLKRFPLADSSALSAFSGPNDLADLLKNFEFENNVLLRILTRRELLAAYQTTDSLAKRVLVELGRKVEN